MCIYPLERIARVEYNRRQNYIEEHFGIEDGLQIDTILFHIDNLTTKRVRICFIVRIDGQLAGKLKRQAQFQLNKRMTVIKCDEMDGDRLCSRWKKINRNPYHANRMLLDTKTCDIVTMNDQYVNVFASDVNGVDKIRQKKRRA